jgi:hypothetical protein
MTATDVTAYVSLQVGGHACAVADVVADVVRDHAGLRGSSPGCPPRSSWDQVMPTSAALV